MPLARLPIDAAMDEIAAAVRTHRAAVITAAPGAGKTTRVPPALAEDGPVIVLQPRRAAARAIARRIAYERGWTTGREVGWHVRNERRFQPDTRVLLATEGILTARVQQDPLLSEFRTIILDEFHERSIHADLGLAFARQAWRARSDLRLVVMSATLETDRVAAFLERCPVVRVPGEIHPLQLDYRPGRSVVDTAADVVRETSGSILCFLPGAREIHRAASEIAGRVPPGVEVLPLHGSLPPDEQDRALEPSAKQRVILATNIAETSVTVPGVSVVIDSGFAKIARYDDARGIDVLELERISADSATQRAGRAARLGPGRAVRLWPETDRLRPHAMPEIHRVDLTEPVLEVLGWGEDPRRFEWFEAPSAARIDAAMVLLRRLGAVAEDRVTGPGRELLRLPIHPRLARMVIAGRGARSVALAAAMLSDNMPVGSAGLSTTSDLLSAIADERSLPRSVTDLAARLATATTRIDDAGFRRAVLAGYPDRVARRRAAGSPRFLLASGHGATLGRDSGVHDAEYIVAIDVQAGRRGEQSEAIIRAASGVDAEWLQPTRVGVEHVFEETSATVRAIERRYYDALVIGDAPVRPDPAVAASLLAEAYRARPRPERDDRLLRRMAFAGLQPDVNALLEAATFGKTALADVSIDAVVDAGVRRELDRLAPERLRVPSGRDVPLDYVEDGVTASVKLQELFGLAESPRVGPRHEPVTFLLLAPNGRPVQTTRDLRSFWTTTYHEVRRELRGRYPKHPWPEDPWSATPTARPQRRR